MRRGRIATSPPFDGHERSVEALDGGIGEAAAGQASTDVADAGVVLAAMIGAALVEAFDQMTAALVVHTVEAGNAAVVMTGRCGGDACRA